MFVRCVCAQSAARSAFQQFDRDHSGFLEAVEVGRLLRELVPDLTSQELRYLVCHLYAVDLNGDGCISFRELLKAMQAMPKPDLAP